MELPNRPAFSCRERAGRSLQKTNDLARSGQLQCRVGPITFQANQIRLITNWSGKGESEMPVRRLTIAAHTNTPGFSSGPCARSYFGAQAAREPLIGKML